MSEQDERRATRYGFQTGRPTLTLQACASPNTPDVHSVIARPPDARRGSERLVFRLTAYNVPAYRGEVSADLVIRGGARHSSDLVNLDRPVPTLGRGDA